MDHIKGRDLGLLPSRRNTQRRRRGGLNGPFIGHIWLVCELTVSVCVWPLCRIYLKAIHLINASADYLGRFQIHDQSVAKLWAYLLCEMGYPKYARGSRSPCGYAIRIMWVLLMRGQRHLWASGLSWTYQQLKLNRAALHVIRHVVYFGIYLVIFRYLVMIWNRATININMNEAHGKDMMSMLG